MQSSGTVNMGSQRESPILTHLMPICDKVICLVDEGKAVNGAFLDFG